jgi:hypothetical protein
MLIQYQQTTRRLLNDAGFTKFNDFDLRDWINIGRNQAAAEGEAIRQIGTFNTVSFQQAYGFSSIVVSGVGFGSVQSVRMIGGGGNRLNPRTWEWLFDYYISPNTPSGVPKDWAQLGQGIYGTIYLGPTPSSVITLSLDVVLLPAALSADSDPESLPYPFTDAVPYFAAYMALLSINDIKNAENFYQLYERFMMRARVISTPSVLPEQYQGSAGAKLAGEGVPIVPSSSSPQQSRQ